MLLELGAVIGQRHRRTSLQILKRLPLVPARRTDSKSISAL